MQDITNKQQTYVHKCENTKATQLLCEKPHKVRTTPKLFTDYATPFMIQNEPGRSQW